MTTGHDPSAGPVGAGNTFQTVLKQNGLKIPPQSITTLQVNITYMCNQACVHCHVGAGPHRTEMMNRDTMDLCLNLLADHPQIITLDITGGAPELNPDFSYLVTRARALGRHVMVRHNLTVMTDGHPATGAGMLHLPEFFASHHVEVVSSFPYFQKYFTDVLRGDGVFEKSIAALKALNAVGYGQPDTDLILNLVYNPAGAFLPAEQATLEANFKQALERHHGVVFNQLYTITNMPIFRFRERLRAIGALDDYWRKLVESFNPCAAEAVMCRNQISVGIDGRLYDCDFNQMLGLEITIDDHPMTLSSFDHDRLLKREIRVAPHCFGCTAGAGSSCGGATA